MADEPQTQDALVEAAEAAEPVDAAEAQKVSTLANAPRLFGKYDFQEVVVSDPGLVKYINLQPVIVPHTSARHGNARFAKHKMNLVERIINEMMRTEDFTGKKASAYRAMREALEVVSQRTKENPIQSLVKAVENAAPREEVTRLRYGGISVPKAVDVSPARRLDTAIRNITTAAVESSYKSKNSIAQCLADEIVKAAKNDMNSYAVGKKEEVERVAKSAR